MLHRAELPPLLPNQQRHRPGQGPLPGDRYEVPAVLARVHPWRGAH